jgi:hypothetical protein
MRIKNLESWPGLEPRFTVLEEHDNYYTTDVGQNSEINI